ncbi:hypothetical protein [Spiroplasma endosymbiont of Dioctria linearis]|uniref:hypothetical protein n=1 Tax=Spiroplasma endosymbiont of Dioctria linearis TaxID=3066290 RepID=UPI00313AD085
MKERQKMIKLLNLIAVFTMSATSTGQMMINPNQVHKENLNYESGIIAQKNVGKLSKGSLYGFNTPLKIENNWYGTIVKENILEFYKVEDKINSEFILVNSIELQENLEEISGKSILIGNEIYYQFIINDYNNYNRANFYKLNLDNGNVENLGSVVLDEDAVRSTFNFSGINFHIYNNKLFILYSDIWYNGASIVSVDLSTSEIVVLKSHNMFSMIFVENKIYYLISSNVAGKSNNLGVYDLETSEDLIFEWTESRLSKLLYYNKDVYVSKWSSSNDYDSSLNKINFSNNKLELQWVVNTPNSSIFNIFNYKNKVYMIEKFSNKITLSEFFNNKLMEITIIYNWDSPRINFVKITNLYNENSNIIFSLEKTNSIKDEVTENIVVNLDLNSFELKNYSKKWNKKEFSTFVIYENDNIYISNIKVSGILYNSTSIFQKTKFI